MGFEGGELHGGYLSKLHVTGAEVDRMHWTINLLDGGEHGLAGHRSEHHGTSTAGTAQSSRPLSPTSDLLTGLPRKRRLLRMYF